MAEIETFEIRYFDGDNSVFALSLTKPNQASSDSYFITPVVLDSNFYWGVRIYTVATDLTETELSSGTPTAIVVRTYTGVNVLAGVQQSYFICPTTLISGGTRIRIKLYRQYESEGWTLVKEFTSEPLSARTLYSSWTIKYYTRLERPVGPSIIYSTFYYGDIFSDYSNINIQYTYTYVPPAGRTYPPPIGPCVSIGTIDTYRDGLNLTIDPVNLPYARVSDNLQEIIEHMTTINFNTWEWWFNYTGALQVAEERGSDKSDIISVVAGNQIGGSINEQISKQTAQRIRVVGRGESATQDETTSDWKENTTEIDNINSFYEKIDTERTISNKKLSDEWAEVLKTQYAPIRQEVTVRLENDPYTADDMDLGDTITVTDPATGLSGTYRIKTIDKNVNNFTGEVTTLTCTKTRTDITDRLADIYNKLQVLLNSDTVMDKLFAEGSRQKKISADIVEDIWEQTASNKWATELPEEKNADPSEDYMWHCDSTGDLDWACNSDEFDVFAAADNTNGWVYLYEPLLSFKRDPRFTCEFIIDSGVDGFQWGNGTVIMYGIRSLYNPDDPAPSNGGDGCDFAGNRGFGFYIIKTGGTYEMHAWLWDSTSTGFTDKLVKIANIAEDVKYIVEARCEWDEKVIIYYFGRADVVDENSSDYPMWGFKMRAILPINIEAVDSYTHGGTTYDDYLCPYHCLLNVDTTTDRPNLYFYRWRTQAVRAVKNE